MTLAVAIVADDLTGALDTATPFVLHGLTVAVAIRADALEQALASGADVVAVNTASRALHPDEAASIVADAAVLLRQAAPAVVMKKIDSRLKGNPGAESAALAEGCRRSRLVVAPAAPDQERLTVAGKVTGRGVDRPIAVAPLFDRWSVPLAVADAVNDADLDAVVASQDWSKALAVGSRGLGLAIARSIGREAQIASFQPDARTLFAFGSRDPITEAQIDHLAGVHVIAGVDAPDGEVGVEAFGLPAVLRCKGKQSASPERVAIRFARHVAAAVERLRPATLVTGGGDTALAILDALGASVVFPGGEAAPGLPWFELAARNGHSFRCVVKSGGFGSPGVLSDLLDPLARP